MGKIVVVGGGWAGCAAAIRARKQGHRVVLLEKTDLLLGLGNVGGIMRNNGRFTAAEENISMGSGELFQITDRLSTHRNVDFPGHKHASFYDTAMVEPEVRRLLCSLGIELKMMTRAIDVGLEKTGRDKRRILRSVLAVGPDKNRASGINGLCHIEIEGDAFVETTGSTGPMGNCVRYGNGCCMCILRCPAFGPRVSLTEKAGNDDLAAERADGRLGAFSGSCKLEKRTLSEELQERLDEDGFAVVALPAEMVHKEKLSQKVCQQYALDMFAENVVLIDTGFAKMMSPYFSLEELRKVPGFENVRFADPYAGGKGNSIRYMAVGLRDHFMRAEKIENLFLGGEKSGFFVGHTEAITTGSLAGYNSARYCSGKELLRLPVETACGDLLETAEQALYEENATARRFTFAGGEYFERMKEKGLYLTDPCMIRQRVRRAGLENVYSS